MKLTEKEINEDFYELKDSDYTTVTLENSEINKLKISLNRLSLLNLNNCSIDHLIIDNCRNLTLNVDLSIDTLEVNCNSIRDLNISFNSFKTNTNSHNSESKLLLNTNYLSYYKNVDKINMFFNRVSLNYLNKDIHLAKYPRFELNLDKNIYYIKYLDTSNYSKTLRINSNFSKIVGEIKDNVELRGISDLSQFNISKESYLEIEEFNSGIPEHLVGNIRKVVNSRTNILNFYKLREIEFNDWKEDLMIIKIIDFAYISEMKGDLSLSSRIVEVFESNISNFSVQAELLKVDIETLNNIKGLGLSKIKKVILVDLEDEEYCSNPILKEFCKKHKIPFMEKNKLSSTL